MAMDIQQRPTQHGHRRDHPCHETKNGRVVLQAGPIKNGGITEPEEERAKPPSFESLEATIFLVDALNEDPKNGLKRGPIGTKIH